ncbi:hypothetical protein QQF64_025728 [Cirrhinus molitorella]|uniref:Uncharacterized protein n=1 Tax=Cirrhinus molitorella TaxID=172907 RepID=A0ABR3NRA4_9TELE
MNYETNAVTKCSRATASFPTLSPLRPHPAHTSPTAPVPSPQRAHTSPTVPAPSPHFPRCARTQPTACPHFPRCARTRPTACPLRPHPVHASPTAPAPSPRFPHCARTQPTLWACLWAHHWPYWGPTLLCLGQPTPNPHFWAIPLWPHTGPIVWGPHVPRISRRYWGPQWAARAG